MPRPEVIRALVTCWPPPKDWFQVCRAWGVVGSWAIGMGSLAAALTWWAIELSPSFQAIHSDTVLRRFPIIPLLASLVGAIPGWMLFVACEFSKHDSKCTELGAAADPAS